MTIPEHLLCRVCGKVPFSIRAYWSDRETYICDSASCRDKVVHWRDNDNSGDRDTIILDDLRGGSFKTIPYEENRG